MTAIPQDFLDIDPSTAHWREVEYDGKGWIVPATETPDTHARLSDMTDAMMSEIPGMDDTVQPIKLEDNRLYKFAMAFLMQDGNLDVPGGRYGANTRQCAEIAILLAVIMQYHSGEPVTYYALNSDMGLVVNSGDGVTEVLSESQYIFDEQRWGIDIKDVLGDAYLPQTPMEKVAAWAESIGGLLSQDEDTITIILDEDDCEKLADKLGDD